MHDHDFEALLDDFDDDLVNLGRKIELSRDIDGNIRRFRGNVFHDCQLPR
jgi:hypothetical protein